MQRNEFLSFGGMIFYSSILKSENRRKSESVTFYDASCYIEN